MVMHLSGLTPCTLAIDMLMQDRTSAMKLESSANDFERGQRNVFKLQAPDLGELVAAIVRKDDSGVGSDWHLQTVEVLHPGRPSSAQRMKCCMARCWPIVGLLFWCEVTCSQLSIMQ